MLFSLNDIDSRVLVESLKRDVGTDAGTALMAVDASSAVPSSVPVSVDPNLLTPDRQ